MTHLRRGALCALLWFSASIGAAAQDARAIDVNGRWVATASPSGPWTFDFTASGGKLTGRIYGDGGEAGPAEILEGIAFTRTVEVPVGGAFGPDNIFSAYAPGSFLARRNAGKAPENAAQARLKQAQFQWQAQGIKQYEYSVSFLCVFCALPRGPVVQRANENVARGAAPSQTGSLNQATALREMFFGNRGSIDAVFSLISAYAATQPFLLEAEYDPKLGYPISVEIHPGGISTDDNLRIEITAFKANSASDLR